MVLVLRQCACRFDLGATSGHGASALRRLGMIEGKHSRDKEGRSFVFQSTLSAKEGLSVLRTAGPGSSLQPTIRSSWWPPGMGRICQPGHGSLIRRAHLIRNPVA